MNLYGHAVVASWHSPDPWHGLGAMLPDLAGLVGARPPTPRSEPVRAGIALHHTTDAAFHASRDFVRLCSEGIEALQRDGLSRGAARAVAHVGVELLLDGELAGDVGGLTCFGDALGLAASHAADTEEALTWQGAGDAGRLRDVATRLAQANIPLVYMDPEVVAERLYRILARRPRLAFDAAHLPGVRRWAVGVQREVRAAAPDVLAALRPAPVPRPW